MRGREIEENLWRAIRFGLDGRMIDFAVGEEIETMAAVERIAEWTAPAREHLGIEAPALAPNGAQRARAGLAEGRSVRDVYREHVAALPASFAPAAARG
jgi:carboxylate-amine ligase